MLFLLPWTAVSLLLCCLVTVFCSLQLSESESRPLYLWQRQSSSSAVCGLCNLTWHNCTKMPHGINVYRGVLTVACGQRLSYTQIIVWVFFLLENATQLMKMLKSNISSACTCFLLNQLWTIIILKPQFWFNRDKHHFMICMMKKSSSAPNIPPFSFYSEVAPPKTNQLSSSCRSRSEIDYFIYFQHRGLWERDWLMGV